MLYKPPGAVYIASYKEPLDQSDCWKLFVQLWSYTNSNFNCVLFTSLSVFVTQNRFLFPGKLSFVIKTRHDCCTPTGSPSGPFLDPSGPLLAPFIFPSPHLLPRSRVPAFSPSESTRKTNLKPPAGFVRFSDYDLVIISGTEYIQNTPFSSDFEFWWIDGHSWFEKIIE